METTFKGLGLWVIGVVEGYIGILERKMETTILRLYRGYIGVI